MGDFRENNPEPNDEFESCTDFHIGDRVVSKVAMVDGKRDASPAKIVAMQWGYDNDASAKQAAFICVQVINETGPLKGRTSPWIDIRTFEPASE